MTDPDGTLAQQVLVVDHVIICAGQESVRAVYDALGPGATTHLIGGAELAVELDAKRAIRQGTRLAALL